MRSFVASALCFSLFTQCLFAQAAAPPQTAQPGAAQGAGQAQVPPAAQSMRPNYVLGPGDMVQIRVLEVEEIGDRPFRVESNGEINIPLIGPVPATGLTVDQLQTELNQRLRRFVVNPQASVILVQFRSDPVFFVGAFRLPGIYPLTGRRTLVEMLTIAGGLAPNASRRIRLTRRKEMGPIPLPSAVEDPDGTGMSVEIPITALTQEINPPEDIPLLPYDMLSVERAELIYLSGEFARPGGYELGDKESTSLIQLVTLAGGATANANLKGARILRPISNSAKRAQIPVNLADVLGAKVPEIKLMANDVLHVPRASRRLALGRIALVVVPVATSLVLIFVRR